jgi:putative redox protein
VGKRRIKGQFVSAHLFAQRTAYAFTDCQNDMVSITARIERTSYETHLSTGSQVVVVDEPVDVGGQDRGMQPGELMAGSLAACIVITLRMYADRKGWPLDSIVAQVDYSSDPDTKRSLFTTQLI